MIDAPLLTVALVFFVLSIGMAWFASRLPVYWQTWSIPGLLIVMFGGLAVAYIRWNQVELPQQVIFDFGTLMLVSFPAMLGLDFIQRRKRNDLLQKLLKITDDELDNENLHSLIWIGLIGLYSHSAGYLEWPGTVWLWCANHWDHLANWFRNFIQSRA